MDNVWGEPWEAYEEFEGLYRKAKGLQECCTPEEVSVLKTAIVSGSKLFYSLGDNHPELKNYISTTTSTLSDLLTELRIQSDPKINPREIIIIKEKTVAIFEAAMEKLRRE